jgi:hypothetical protein
VQRTSPGVRGFAVQPKRWVVERTFSWLSRNRRLSKDYERKVQTSETFIEVAMIRLLVARLGRRTSSRVTQFVRNLQTPRHGLRVSLHA